VALRFAPNDEYIALIQKAADKQLPAEELKKMITRWKGDYHRA
jgi:hypothetical protein